MKAILVVCLVVLGLVIIARGWLDCVTLCDAAVGIVFGAILNELLRGDDDQVQR